VPSREIGLCDRSEPPEACLWGADARRAASTAAAAAALGWTAGRFAFASPAV
jgi:hypothetical protein